MGGISPINPGSTAASGRTPALSGGTPAAAAGATSQTRSATITQSLQFTNVTMAVSDMMRQIGGGLENNRILQMLIALMILSALLEQSQQQRQGLGDEAMQALAARGSGNAAEITFNSFSYQETHVSVGSTSSTEAFNGQGGTDTGRQFDVAV